MIRVKELAFGWITQASRFADTSVAVLVVVRGWRVMGFWTTNRDAVKMRFEMLDVL